MPGRTVHYLAYGSNLHPLRLLERVPSAKLKGVVKLSHHRLTFHKRSVDGSGKCTLFRTGAATDAAYGAVYELESRHKDELDLFEGPGYRDGAVDPQHLDRDYACFTYFARRSYVTNQLKPYHWYKELVVLGARYLHLPAAYVELLASVESIEDPDPGRRTERAALIGRIRDY